MMYRVMIVEDEAFIRAGIISLVNWEDINCEVVHDCTNGEEALEYVKDHDVDIIITDIKMPKMDGLELIRRVKSISPNVISIILTAYSEFTYAQKAIEYGVIRFVMKNDFVNELPSAIELACTQLDERKDRGRGTKSSALNDAEIREIKSYILESLALSKMIHDEDFLDKYKLIDQNYCVCNCEILYEVEDASLKTIKTIEKILKLVIQDYDYYLVDIKREHFMIIITEREDDQNVRLEVETVARLCRKVINMIKELMHIDIKIGVSSVISQATDLHLAYKESLEALVGLVYQGNNLRTYQSDSKVKGKKLDSDQYIQQIVEHLFDKQSEKAIEAIDQFKKEAVESCRDFKKCKVDCSRLLTKIFEKLSYYDVAYDMKAKETRAYEAIDKSRSIYSLFRVCKNVIHACEDIIQNQKIVKSYLINNINQYINKNYASNISLDDISEQMHVSKSYICRIYKKKVGITLTEAINRRRIKKAKKLLEKSSERISEIGYMVGFDSAAYFTTIFKKYVGISPSDYRNNHVNEH